MRCLSRSPLPQLPTTPLPAFSAGNQGRRPSLLVFVPVRLNKLALMRAGKTCSKGREERLKGAKTKKKRGEKTAASNRTPTKGYIFPSIYHLFKTNYPFCHSVTKLLFFHWLSPISRLDKALRSNTAVAWVVAINESWMRLCEHC